ncbi:MAG: DNA polymerase I, partial [Planctomycetota bacterium]
MSSSAADRGDYRLIATVEELDELIAQVRTAGECAVDTETDSLAPVSANLCGVSISVKSGTGAYIPTRSPQPDRHLDTKTVLQRLRPVLEDASIDKIGQNLKFDINVFRRHDVKLAGNSFDTMIASYL